MALQNRNRMFFVCFSPNWNLSHSKMHFFPFQAHHFAIKKTCALLQSVCWIRISAAHVWTIRVYRHRAARFEPIFFFFEVEDAKSAAKWRINIGSFSGCPVVSDYGYPKPKTLHWNHSSWFFFNSTIRVEKHFCRAASPPMFICHFTTHCACASSKYTKLAQFRYNLVNTEHSMQN